MKASTQLPKTLRNDDDDERIEVSYAVLFANNLEPYELLAQVSAAINLQLTVDDDSKHLPFIDPSDCTLTAVRLIRGEEFHYSSFFSIY